MRQLVWLAMRCISFDLTTMSRSRDTARKNHPHPRGGSRAISHNTQSALTGATRTAFMGGALALMHSGIGGGCKPERRGIADSRLRRPELEGNFYKTKKKSAPPPST